MALIEANHLCKEFKIYKRNSGAKETIKSLFHREYDIKKAVEDISFSVERGELVGYIGPNGAGKSTTIKMLSGILFPSSGEVLVDGIKPYENRKANAAKIGIVFGQRSQLFWDLPMVDGFELYQKMYKMEEKRFQENVAYYTEILDMKEFINRPIRQLSLGQKMRAELAIALLHDPEILYLDEPTIGLDVLAKRKIRETLKDINRERNTTVILTTHDMDDIEEICSRLILIDEGKKIYDGTLHEFKERYADDIVIQFSYTAKKKDLPEDVKVKQESESCFASFLSHQYTAAHAAQVLLDAYDISDFAIKNNDIEDIIARLYLRGGKGQENKA